MVVVIQKEQRILALGNYVHDLLIETIGVYLGPFKKKKKKPKQIVCGKFHNGKCMNM